VENQKDQIASFTGLSHATTSGLPRAAGRGG